MKVHSLTALQKAQNLESTLDSLLEKMNRLEDQVLAIKKKLEAKASKPSSCSETRAIEMALLRKLESEGFKVKLPT